MCKGIVAAKFRANHLSLKLPTKELGEITVFYAVLSLLDRHLTFDVINYCWTNGNGEKIYCPGMELGPGESQVVTSNWKG